MTAQKLKAERVSTLCCRRAEGEGGAAPAARGGGGSGRGRVKWGLARAHETTSPESTEGARAANVGSGRQDRRPGSGRDWQRTCFLTHLPLTVTLT